MTFSNQNQFLKVTNNVLHKYLTTNNKIKQKDKFFHNNVTYIKHKNLNLKKYI